MSVEERKENMQSWILSRIEDIDLILGDELAQGVISQKEYDAQYKEYERQKNRVTKLFGFLTK